MKRRKFIKNASLSVMKFMIHARVDFIYHRLKELNIALSKHRTAYIFEFAKTGQQFYNGKLLQVSSSTP